jgi:hypothetical protein
MEGNLIQKEEKRMRLRRMIVMLAAVASLSLGLPPAMSAAYAASAAPVAHPTAGVPAPAGAAAASTAQTGSHSVSFLSPGTHGKQIALIQFRECSGQTTTWVGIDLLQTSGLQDWCFGGGGIWRFYTPNNNITSVCAGNNYGTFRYTHNGTPEHWDFAPGHRFSSWPPVQAVSLTITGWAGGDTCTS